MGFRISRDVACAELWDTLGPAIEEDADFDPASEETPLAIARVWSVSPYDLRDLLGDDPSTGWIGAPEFEGARLRA